MPTAIVTGGASGIGRALATELAGSGVRVLLGDRQADVAEQVAAEIRARGGTAEAVELDVRDGDRFREVVRAAAAHAGRLDYLFNNAGIGIGGEARDFDLADWNDVIDVNLRGVVHGILAAYPLMIAQGFGHIGEDRVPIFALPGNPVSSYVSFELFVLPALRKMMGRTPYSRPTLRARLTESFRSAYGKTQLVRGRYDAVVMRYTLRTAR